MSYVNPQEPTVNDAAAQLLIMRQMLMCVELAGALARATCIAILTVKYNYTQEQANDLYGRVSAEVGHKAAATIVALMQDTPPQEQTPDVDKTTDA